MFCDLPSSDDQFVKCSKIGEPFQGIPVNQIPHAEARELANDSVKSGYK